MREPAEKFLRRAELFRRGRAGAVECLACARACVIPDGARGFCGVRRNSGGELFAPWGCTAGIALDPVEKKPFFHALPAAKALSFGMLGCNLRCAFCQNSGTSLPGPETADNFPLSVISPAELAAQAASGGAPLIVSTYNEPLVTCEWAHAVFTEAKKKGLRTGFVSNGYASREALDFMRPCLDLYKIDLKGFNEESYRRVTGGELKKALVALELVHSMGFWLEVVTLVVPGFNDSPDELGAVASFIAGLSKNIPWHVTAFYPAHKMSEAEPTPRETVLRAREIGLKKGLNFVYAGNIRGSGDAENTLCPACGKLLVERRGFTVVVDTLSRRGTCPSCSARVPGVWQ